MYIIEFFDTIPNGYRTEKDDNSVERMSDQRKSRLTLAQIGRLRQMNDLKKFELEKKIGTLSKQYHPAVAEPMPGM
jgi:hypothetical protein